MIGVPFAMFFAREYSSTLFRAQIKVIRMLQGSIHAANTPFLPFFRNFNDFYAHRAYVGMAHLPYGYLLLLYVQLNPRKT